MSPSTAITALDGALTIAAISLLKRLTLNAATRSVDWGGL
jgi:hypothetical protein